jgi:hypothetical protein
MLDPTGRFLGVVTADFDLNALSTFVAQLSVSPNSRFFLYTADETLLAHPTRGVVVPARQKTTGRLLTLADTDDPLVDAFRGRVSAAAPPARSSESFRRFQFERDGAEYLASTTAFRVGDDQVQDGERQGQGERALQGSSAAKGARIHPRRGNSHSVARNPAFCRSRGESKQIRRAGFSLLLRSCTQSAGFSFCFLHKLKGVYVGSLSLRFQLSQADQKGLFRSLHKLIRGRWRAAASDETGPV